MALSTRGSGLVADFFAGAIGWGICMLVVAGSYAVGFWLAPFFGGEDHKDSFGILSALVVIWIYEHQRANERYERLQEIVGELQRERR